MSALPVGPAAVGPAADAPVVLVTGATAGIGRALARAIRDLPSKPTVIAMGRRQERLDELAMRLPRATERLVRRARERTALTASKLDALSPLRVLARGYSITFRASDGAPLLTPAAAPPGTLLRTRLADGELSSRVEEPAS